MPPSPTLPTTLPASAPLFHPRSPALLPSQHSITFRRLPSRSCLPALFSVCASALSTPRRNSRILAFSEDQELSSSAYPFFLFPTAPDSHTLSSRARSGAMRLASVPDVIPTKGHAKRFRAFSKPSSSAIIMTWSPLDERPCIEATKTSNMVKREDGSEINASLDAPHPDRSRGTSWALVVAGMALAGVDCSHIVWSQAKPTKLQHPLFSFA